MTERGPCQSLRFAGSLDFTGYRCGRPEDDGMHDPLGPADAHVYDPAPVLTGETDGE